MTNTLPIAKLDDINPPSAAAEVELACALHRHGMHLMQAALNICAAQEQANPAPDNDLWMASDAAASAVMAISHFHARKS